MGQLSTSSIYARTLDDLKVKVGILDASNINWIKICEKTVEGYREELYDENINLGKDVTEEYVNLLIKDMNKLLIIIRDYKGDYVDKMKAAGQNHIEVIFKSMATISLAFDYFEEPSSAKKLQEAKIRVQALNKCRAHLDKAYKYLRGPDT